MFYIVIHCLLKDSFFFILKYIFHFRFIDHLRKNISIISGLIEHFDIDRPTNHSHKKIRSSTFLVNYFIIISVIVTISFLSINHIGFYGKVCGINLSNKIFIETKKKMVLNKDVIFDEKIGYLDNQNSIEFSFNFVIFQHLSCKCLVGCNIIISHHTHQWIYFCH